MRVLRDLPKLRVIKAHDNMKDISEAHLQGLDVPVLIENLKLKAEYGEVLQAQETNELSNRLYNQAKTIVEAQDPLELVSEAIRKLGYGGDLKPALVGYLAATSRLLSIRLLKNSV